MLLNDTSAGTAGSKKITLAELVNVPSFQTAFNPLIGTGGLALSKIAQAGATTGQGIVWNGTAWAPSAVAASLTSGPVTSSGTTSAIADAALSIAKTSGLQAALDTKRPVVNVKSFGATGNGATDDTAAIVAASNSLRLTGGTLFFPSGTYRIRAAEDGDGLPWGAGAYGEPMYGPRPCFQIFSNMTIEGDGPGNTTLKYADVTNDGPMIHLNTSSNITMRNLTLDGNSSRMPKPAGGGESEGFDTKRDCRNLRIENCHFRNILNEAIDFDNGDGITQIGWDLDGYQILITGCVFENVGGEAIHNPNWGIIENCQFRNVSHDRWLTANDGNSAGSEGQGAIDGSGENMIVRNCSFTDCVRAFHIYRKVGDNANTYLGQAKGVLTFAGQPVVGETVTVAGQVYTWSPAGKAVSGVAATDIFTSTAHGWADTTPVRFTYRDGGGGFVGYTTYYVRDSTGNTFKLAATSGGAAIDLNSTMANGRITNDWPLTGEIELGATANLTATNLSQAVNGDLQESSANSGARAVYSAPSIASGTPAIVTLIAKPKGVLGDAVTLDEASTNVTKSAATLAGGGTRNESNIRIENCIVENWIPIAGGIKIDTPDNVVISGCTFLGRGPAIFSSAPGMRVVNCDVTILDNTQSGMSVSLLGLNSVISNTRIRGGVLYTSGSGLTVTACDISSAYGALQVEGASCSGVKVIGCTLATAGNTVLGVAGNLPVINFQHSTQTNHVAMGNRITGGNHGIAMASQSTATGNVITGVAFNGITLYGTGNVVSGNYTTAGTSGIVNTGLSNTIVGNYGTGLPVEHTGANRSGNVSLVGGGIVTVANTSVTANTIVMVTRKTAGGTPGTGFTYTVTPGVSFTVISSDPADLSLISYTLIN